MKKEQKNEKQLKIAKKIKFSQIPKGTACGQSGPASTWCINAYQS